MCAHACKLLLIGGVDAEAQVCDQSGTILKAAVSMQRQVKAELGCLITLVVARLFAPIWRMQNFSCVDFVDTPGLVDGDMQVSKQAQARAAASMTRITLDALQRLR